MNIGYACLAVGVPGTDLKSCIRKNATPDRLQTLIAHNLESLEQMLRYNHRMGIRLFRISSDIIPFGGNPANSLDWPRLFAPTLARIGTMALEWEMRLSMHPGQYTVLNSPDEGVVERSIADLEYHAAFLDALGLGGEHKLILHIGGIYGDKQAAAQRFLLRYHTLSPAVKKRLVIENDHSLYTIADVLQIGQSAGIPVVFDNLHHQIHPACGERSELDWIDACRSTWGTADGPQKLHFSQQAPGKKTGSHSDRVEVDGFLDFYRSLQGRDVDIMLEVKDKNLSAVACLNCVASPGHIKYLEQEWARYKYTVLERAPATYQKIRQLLQDKSAYPAQEFYRLLHQALEQTPTNGGAANAAQHVWGYFKDDATNKEKANFQQQLEAFRMGHASIGRIKGHLHRLAVAHSRHYLLDSLYFTL